MSKPAYSCRCIDINASDYRDESFKIQIYGIDENRKTYSIRIDDFKPFFYIKVGNDWTDTDMKEFIEFIKESNKEDYGLKKMINEEIHEMKLVKHKTLYNFDANKSYKFIYISCHSLSLFYKIKRLYYDSEKQRLTEGVEFNGSVTKLYEIMIPPMLRFFHIQNISPSGWIEIQKYSKVPKAHKQTTCDYEFIVKSQNIISLEDKEISVPYKICSFDIEASSSHGDFPNAKKNYKKVAYDIVEYIYKNSDIVEEMGLKFTLKNALSNVFRFVDDMGIDHCELKQKYTKEMFDIQFEKFFEYEYILPTNNELENSLKDYFNSVDDEDENGEQNGEVYTKSQRGKTSNVSDILTSNSFDNQQKIGYILIALNKHFPAIKGDYVTFIGSTFITYGEEKSHLNHCICLGDTTNVDEDTQMIECYDNERDVLIAWTKLIQKEDPDIIIGYNIFGFDYLFMFDRACENNCEEEFMKLGRNNKKNKIELSETSIVLASGAYDLKYPAMDGRLQIDVYTYMRKEFQLPSYKLDFVSSYLISDSVKSYVNLEDNTCKIYTKNMKGITLRCFVHFEIVNHSNDDYEGGKKFKVIDIQHDGFVIEGNLHDLDDKKIQWGLAKDDVTPQDIFRMTNEGPDQKGIIAKYCIQDCNLVHQIFQKIDIMTTYIEMSKICSVPISFLMLRGQGIKLTSYIAKKCREKDTLMPLISKGHPNDAYEGAIVLEPKCNLYLDNPVACVDYSSLYPSSIISENISHDSKVWTKTYDLAGKLINKTGIVNRNGDFKYDNLPGYKYVDIKYDTFTYIRKHVKAAAKKVLTGYKVCRYAQFPEGEKAIMPSILQELLAARKATKKQMAKESDPFMKNILDKRQLSIKVTANSLYGQTGAKTSTFYEMDVAASTTATGRKLLIYARDIIENVYQNLEIDTKYGPMMTNAEYIYGDSVANYTPIYIRNGENGLMNIVKIEDLGKIFQKKWKNCVEPGKQEKEYIDLSPENVYTWSDKGWTQLITVIRHKLAPHKKMMRILTHTGCVDVTDDHSLLRENGQEVSPAHVNLGDALLHKTVNNDNCDSNISKDKARILGFFFGDGSCGQYKCLSGKKSSWALNNKSISLLEIYKELCQKVYPELTWKIYDTIKSSNVYKLSFTSDNDYGKNVLLVKQYREMMYNGKNKNIPQCILNGSREIKEEFLRGLYDADGNKCDNIKRIYQKSQLSSSQIAYIIQSIGYNVSINTRQDKPDIFRMNYSSKKHRKNPNLIKKISLIDGYDDYVYDLTTTNHHFAAGVGNLIVHNTDSVFFTFNLKDKNTGEPVVGQKALEVTIEFAKEAGHLATKFLKDPHDLEYEKTFMPFCLLSKKRYVGMLYEEDPHKCKCKSMGIVLKRRDNAPIVKDVYGGIIDILMKDKNIDKSIDFLNGMLDNIVNQKVNINKLIISKSLRSFYKNPDQIAHKVLADRMGVRDPGNKPGPGDRIPYVYILNKKKNDLQGNRIEHPDYIQKNKTKIDYGFYITNQIMKPVLQIYSLILLDMPQFKRKKQMFLQKLKTLESNMDDYDKYLEKIQKLKDKEVEKLLFSKHLMINNNNKNNNTMITSFFK